MRGMKTFFGFEISVLGFGGGGGLEIFWSTFLGGKILAGTFIKGIRARRNGPCGLHSVPLDFFWIQFEPNWTFWG